MEYIAVGTVLQAHGLEGYIKVSAFADMPERYLNLKTIYLESHGSFHGYLVDEVKIQQNGTLVKLRGIDERNAAKVLVKAVLYVPEDQKVKLPEDSYFIHELIGLNVYDIDGRFLGILERVYQNAGNDVYEVRNEEREILVPAVSEFVLKIDLANKKMTVRLIEGMAE